MTATEQKESNPKDAIGSTKVPLSLVPMTAIAHEALAFAEGASKYGKYNWRIAGVRASVYADALQRHFFDWFNGEDYAPDSLVHHLAHVRACCGVILDAMECGTLTDDRAPYAPLSRIMEEMRPTLAAIVERNAALAPHQYTIADKGAP